MIHKHLKNKQGGGDAGAVYGLGMIGAAIFYLQHATNFMDGLLGLVKAIFWPALLVYTVLGKL